MKYVIRLLVLTDFVALGLGFYIKNTVDEVLGTKIIGFSVLGLAFIVMPAFIIYRFRKSDKSKYIFSPTEKNEELEDLIRNREKKDS